MNVLIGGEILLFGTVGADLFDDGFTAMDVVDALARVGRSTPVTVRINSGGGYASEGVAIFNALKAHRGAVSVSIEGVAASAASVIAMAGKTIAMAAGAIMMVHEPSVMTVGDLGDHQKSLDYLGAIASGLADIYAERTGQTVEQCRADMKAESWMTAEEAVAKGYADTTIAGGQDAPPTAFDYRVYGKAPERMVALAAAKGWRFKAPARVASEIRDAVAIARRQNPEINARQAEVYIAAGTPLDQVRADLFAKMTEAADQLITDATPSGSSSTTAADWDDVIAKVNAAHGVKAPSDLQRPARG